MMKQEVKILLKKYFEAETTLQEERQLREYFQQGNPDRELMPYGELFSGLGFAEDAGTDAHTEEEIMDYILEHESRGKNRYRQMWLTISGVAASLLIAVGGMLYYQQQPYKDTFSDPREAFNYAEHTLQFVSSRFNKGLAQLEPMQMISEPVRHLENGLRLANKGFDLLPQLTLQENNEREYPDKLDK